MSDEDATVLVPRKTTSEMLIMLAQRDAEIGRLRAKVTELSNEAYEYAEQVQTAESRASELSTALLNINESWVCSDGGAGGVEDIAAAIRKGTICALGVTDRDVAETMPESIQ